MVLIVEEKETERLIFTSEIVTHPAHVGSKKSM